MSKLKEILWNSATYTIMNGLLYGYAGFIITDTHIHPPYYFPFAQLTYNLEVTLIGLGIGLLSGYGVARIFFKKEKNLEERCSSNEPGEI